MLPFLTIALLSFAFSFLLHLTRHQITYFKLYVKQNPNQKTQPLIHKTVLLSEKKGYQEFFSFNQLFFEGLTFIYSWIFIQSITTSFLFHFSSFLIILFTLFSVNHFLVYLISQKFLHILTYPLFPLFSCYWILFGWLGKVIYRIKFFFLNLKILKNKSYPILSKESLNNLETQEKGILQKNQVYFINNILKLKSLKIIDIQTPRTDIVALDINSSYNDVLKIVKKTNYSRIPVYEKNLDQIKGILKTTDLVNLKEPTNSFLKDIIRKPFFIPNFKKVLHLLETFKEERYHMAIIVDEYGGTDGILTLDDILEEIVGKIYDENDVKEDSIKKLKNNQYLVDPTLTIDEINQFFGIKIPIKDKIEAYTLAGFILFLADKIPSERQTFSFRNIQFQIAKMEEQSIKQVLMTFS